MGRVRAAVTRLMSSDRSDAAPPLTRAERIVLIVVIVAAEVANIVSLVTAADTKPVSYVFDPLVTAIFAVFLFSPGWAVALLTLAMVVSLPIGLSGEALTALALAMGLVTGMGSIRLITVFAGIVLVSSAAGSLAGLGEGPGVAFVLLLAAGSGGIGLVLRAARTREQRFLDRISEQERLLKEVQREERLLIADELHDVIAHDLTAIAMQARVMDHQDDPAQRAQTQREIGDSARRALHDLRRLISRDEPETPPQRVSDLHETIEAATRSLAAAGYTAVTTIDVSYPVTRLVEGTLSRIVRESATNILKHGEPGEVGITIDTDPSIVTLEIRSARRRRATSPAIPSGGYGSARLRERVALLGGEFSSAGEGSHWIVRASLPLS